MDTAFLISLPVIFLFIVCGSIATARAARRTAARLTRRNEFLTALLEKRHGYSAGELDRLAVHFESFRELLPVESMRDDGIIRPAARHSRFTPAVTRTEITT